MKKVLIVAYFFPPETVVGSQRPYRLAKYFTRFGWEPIVLTIKRPGKPPVGIRMIETGFKDFGVTIKSMIGFDTEKGFYPQLGVSVSKDFDHKSLKSKIIKLFKEVINFPDSKRGWYKFALESASEFLSKESVDAIISTSGPVTSHLIARKLKHKYGIPWVADLRDLWTNNHFYNKYKLTKYFEKRLELKTLSDADVLVTVTHRFVDELKTLHKDKNIISITNGYDTDDFSDTQIKLTNEFTITHTGKLYNGKRDPLLLFEVVANLINEKKLDKKLIKIRFYGFKKDWLIQDIKKYNLEGFVDVYDFIPRKEVLKKQKESQLLLLLIDKNNKEESVYPAKIFEYFGARRPIIGVGGNGGIVKEILKEINIGMFASNANLLRDIILKYYNEFLEYGEVKFCDNNTIENYTYDSITRKYSEVLNGLVLK
ncbi:MAG: hypothetical protein D8M57_15505 [Candidatus Scalindua sp. AMX11]|nr:MAG: hypothetical protein DWQ00_06015 [Candidatus Scalindua sp.]NOG82555.1 glycosyltransferase [Planctomycetota bacterium]RZV93984.1 MAG: hypothetical protein EX341_03775 [Candidatus Scalindua sp. SCAELEC01]TDE63973.1 MAG: hypothetical protein D8M57_15505 [Candidatus Scalindua sp. AMX11]GJQ57450.1 MAG: glycosyl transferase family 1 [Candidatus Scalindua sp.]